MTNNITGSEVYKRTATYDRDANTIRLHAPQWKMLLAFDGQRSLTEIASNVGSPLAEAMGQAGDFLKKDWIAEQPISLEEYLRRASAGGGYSGGVIPPSVVIEPKAESKLDPKPAGRPASGPLPPASSGGGTPPSLVPTMPPPLSPPSMPAVAPSPTAPLALSQSGALPSREQTPASPARGAMRLSAVVDYIVSLAESVPLGQLLAYRVFLRVPPEVLQSEDIVSIHLVEDSSLVKSEALQKAIGFAVQEIVKRALPESVFAPA